MNGDDLIHLASQLVANATFGHAEARFRSSVSRAYYGAYHWAVLVLKEFKVTVPRNANGHEIVHQKLLATKVPIAVEAARLLNDLRRDRNEADYDIDKPRLANMQNAMVCVENASDAVNNLRQCLNGPEREQLEHHFGS